MPRPREHTVISFSDEENEMLKAVSEFRRKHHRIPSLVEGFRIAKSLGWSKVVDKIDLTPGTIYDYAPRTKRKVDGAVVAGNWILGRYSILGVARDVHTMQEQIVYKGEGGKDDGKWFVCTPADFACRFLPVVTEPVVETIPEKIADHSNRGKDW